jgi:hypothetical protein
MNLAAGVERKVWGGYLRIAGCVPGGCRFPPAGLGDWFSSTSRPGTWGGEDGGRCVRGCGRLIRRRTWIGR